jgi:integrase/ribosomal protein L40E
MFGGWILGSSAGVFCQVPFICGGIDMARHEMGLDIHTYQQKFSYAERQVRESEISEKNKTLILGYRDACLVKNVCGKVRLIRVMGVLLLYARLLKKDFDQATKEDIERLLGALLSRQPSYSPETLGTYRAMLKNFMTWVIVPDRFPTTRDLPPQVSWITSHVKARDKKRLDRRDLLTPEDIEKLLGVIHNPRDKALVSVLWETGCRIAEIGNLQLKHITKGKHGYLLDVNGKTGRRSPIIISSAPYLTVWLQNHPFANNPESPLWVHYQYNEKPLQLKYDSIRYLLIRYFERAGIKKPIRPHLFRHSRATFVLANAIMNEQQAKCYFGWTPSSSMLATYSHLIDQDANNAILRENNLTPVQQRNLELQPVTCRICNEINPPRAEYCAKCGAVLDLRKAYEHQETANLKDELFINVFRLLVQKGMVDEAAKEIHDANLGTTLKRLALHLTGETPLHPALANPPSHEPPEATLPAHPPLPENPTPIATPPAAAPPT